MSSLSMNSGNPLMSRLYRNKALRKGIKKLTSSGLRRAIKKVGFSRSKSKALDKETEKFLKALYKEDIQALEQIIHRDLKHWYE